MKCYFVYILTNQSHSVLYVGFTDDIIRRIEEHRSKKYIGFTSYYNVSKLLYFEKHLTSEEAMQREKQLKKWNRNWKEELINKINPAWVDLAENFKKKHTPFEVLELLFKNVKN